MDAGEPSGGRSRPEDGNTFDHGEGVEDTNRGEIVIRQGKATTDGYGQGKATEGSKRKGKGKGMGNGSGKYIVKQTPGGVDISHAIALPLQKEMSQADMDMDG